MNKQCRKSNIQYMSGLFKFFMIFGLAPPYNRESNKIIKNKQYGYYIILLQLCYICLFCHHMYFLIFNTGTSDFGNALDIIILDFLLGFVSTIAMISLTLSTKKVKLWNELWKNLKSLDYHLHADFDKKSYYIYRVELAVYFSILFGSVVQLIYNRIIVDQPLVITFYYFIINTFSFLFMPIIYNILASIKLRFKLFNEILSKDCSNIIKLSQIHVHLIDSVNYFNDIFGYPLFYLYTLNIIITLLAADMVFINADDLKNGKHLIVLQQVVFHLMGIFQLIVLMAKSHQVTSEASKSSFLVYKILENYPVKIMVVKEISKDSINLLFFQTLNFVPEISAANFFVMNYSTIFSFLTFIGSYLTILMQLHD